MIKINCYHNADSGIYYLIPTIAVNLSQTSNRAFKIGVAWFSFEINISFTTFTK